ncbi:MAG: transcriptional repressor [Chloroflexi bacterium]|nr:transcriptional repressor [Chloroflexota bacterium]
MLSTPTPILRAGLRENRRKLTRPRQVVLEIISQANHHLTPAEIYRQAKMKYPHLGLTTVYRTLDLLVELGYVQRIHLAEGCHSYAPIAQSHGHHLVCSNCGRAEEFSDCDLEGLVQSLQGKTGYAIDVHVLELMGLCPDCQTKARGRKR